jgi:replicative DNA helicase
MIKECAGNKPEKRQRHLNIFDKVKQHKVDLDEFKWLIKKIREEYNDRVQRKAFKDIKTGLNLPEGEKRVEKINQIIKKSTVEIDSIGAKKMYKEGTLRDSALERVGKYKHIKEHPELARGILTGLSTLDRISNGLHPGELMIIAGDTGTGKSILMHNIAVNAYLAKNNVFNLPDLWNNDGHNVLYFSLEMPKESIERRIDSCLGEVYANQIRDGLLPKEDEIKYQQCLKFQKEYSKHFYIVDMPKGATTREIELKYIEISETSFRPDLVVVDYLGIMSSNEPTGSDWMDLGIISAELHEFARVYEIPVVTGSQVNRTKDGAEVYNTRRIARSGMVPNNANIILQIGCREDEDLRTDMPVFITKMRDGEKGMFTLSKDFGRMKVIDIIEDSFADEEFDIV